MNRREQLAWLAGLIDGEGCISLTRRSPQRKNRCVSPSYRLVLKVLTKLVKAHLVLTQKETPEC